MEALELYFKPFVISFPPYLQSLNQVLYSNDPKDLPLTDLDAAASLPYDTDIPEGGNLDNFPYFYKVFVPI